MPGKDTKEKKGGSSQAPLALLHYPDDCGVTWLLGVNPAPFIWQSTQFIVPLSSKERFAAPIQGELFFLGGD